MSVMHSVTVVVAAVSNAQYHTPPHSGGRS
jgi:hypothetical protein